MTTTAQPHASSKTVLLILSFFSLFSGLAAASSNLALPQMSRALDVTNGEATWIVLIGIMTTSIFLVMFGHIGDVISKEVVFLYGGTMFSLGSLLCGLAPNFFLILFGRFIQAIGSAMIMANSMGIITDSFPANQRGKAIAIISMFTSVGSVSGPAIGGVILGTMSWRWIFLMNVPFTVILTIIGCKALAVHNVKLPVIENMMKTANWTGQNIFTLGIVLFFGSGIFFQAHTHNYLLGALLLLGGAALTVASFIQDDRNKNPWIDRDVIRNPQFMGSVATMALAMLVNVVSNILLPFYLQSFLSLSAVQSGMIMVLQSGTMFFITPIAGYLADKIDRHILTVIGLVVLTGSQAAYAFAPMHVNYALIIIPIVLNGVGMGLFLSPNNALTMSFVPKSLSGLAGSLNSLFRTLGMGIGISLGSTILFIQLPGVQFVAPALGHRFLTAYANVFWVATAISAVCLVWAIAMYIMSRKPVPVKE